MTNELIGVVENATLEVNVTITETGPRGLQGEKGADGYTPVKGVDYFDGDKGEKGDDGFTPIKGVDYFDGIDGKDGIQGIQGEPGPQGEPGVVDYTYVDAWLSLKADKTYVDTKLSEKANKTQEAWITPTLLNGWVNENSAYEELSYMKDSLGFVHLRGTVKGGSARTVATLPLGYRSNKIHMFGALRLFSTTPTYGYANTNGDIVLDGSQGSIIIDTMFYV